MYSAVVLAVLWSAITWSVAQNIVIHEIMYHPSSEDDKEEYIELRNLGDQPANLAGWRFNRGVRFTFPEVWIAPEGLLVVTADIATFRRLHPAVSNIIGDWQGALSNSGEEVELENSRGQRVDAVRYADDGDWATRRRGPLDFGHRGWEWFSEADGGGKSLELINPLLSNNCGQNWTASRIANGTPGLPNSESRRNIPPLILSAAHNPLAPRSTDEIQFSVQLQDEASTGSRVSLNYRIDPSADFKAEPMYDDGLHGDGKAMDRMYGLTLRPQANQSIIEFYFVAMDSEGNARTWPAPALVDGVFAQAANLLLQVDDTSDSGDHPLYRLIMTETERAELASLGRSWFDATSHAQMNGTFISHDGTGSGLRYNVGIRNRGNGSRVANPNNYRVNFRNDQPWKDVVALNLNSQFTFVQLAGSALFQRAGLPVGQSRAVQVRVNGANLAAPGYPMHGFYVANEVLNSEFAERQFPGDSSGNIYRGIRLGLYSADPGTRATNFSANLTYLGELSEPYRVNYFKQTNTSQDDWRDLIGLTRSLALSSTDPDYARAVRQTVNVEQWLRFLALSTLLDNNETSISNGDGDDYFMYAGRLDQRFILLPYDLDTLMGQGNTPGSVTAGIFRATQIPALDRFLKHPHFAPEYYRQLDQLIHSIMSSVQLSDLFERVLAPFTPRESVDALKTFAARRNAFVLSQIPRKLTIETDRSTPGAVTGTTSASVALRGTADVIRTRSVKVNGLAADWSAWEGRWSAAAVPVRPGVNRMIVQALDASGLEIERQTIDIVRASEPVPVVASMLSRDSNWESGPYIVSGTVIVPEGVTLTIGAGVTVYFRADAGLLVRGRLIVRGTDTERIRFTRLPGTTDVWRGLQFVNTLLDNELSYCDLEFASAGPETIRVDHSRLTIDHTTWFGTTKTVLELANASVVVRHCDFPNVHENETVHGVGMPANGEVIFENNVFGTTTGYSDVIDFSGGKRPGPIVQILNNKFLGGSDDGVDLDAADAHIEGNLFRGFHKNNSSDSTSSAIATDLGSEITVVRNIFVDNDTAILLKDGATLVAQNNTIVGSTFAAISFGEPQRGVPPGRAAYLDGNILWNNAKDFVNLNLAGFRAELNVNRSLLSAAAVNLPNSGILSEDPRFLDATGNFRLGAGSPALGAGLHGIDLGAHVPFGAFISGEPPSTTSSSNARLNVSGPGITHYKFRVNEGPFSGPIPIDQPIDLKSQPPGTYSVFVVGRNSANVWQREALATKSRTWTVLPHSVPVILNEVLASNRSVLSLGTEFPGLIELHNQSDEPFDISGIGLSDDSSQPYKFTFPARTILEGGDYLTLFATLEGASSELSLGFALNPAGQALYLTDAASRGGRRLESVTFGLQIPDYSIGRRTDGAWALSTPSLGAPNVSARTGDVRALRINEWLAASRAAADFVEIFNGDSLPVALEGVALTDNSFAPLTRKVIAPLTFIPAKGTVVFLEDDADAQSSASNLGFELASEQGVIGLFDTNGRELDFVIYGPQRSGVSEGRSIENPDVIRDFVQPTPNNVNTVSLAEPDIDGDGLPDSWELGHGLDAKANDGARDRDGDGQSNLAEYLSGTDPLDATSVLRLSVSPAASGGVVIQFTAARGHSYVLQSQDALSPRIWRSVAVVSTRAVDEWIELDASRPVSGHRFYRLLSLGLR